MSALAWTIDKRVALTADANATKATATKMLDMKYILVMRRSVGERPRLQGVGSKLLIGYISRVSVKVAWHLNEAGAHKEGVPWLLKPVR